MEKKQEIVATGSTPAAAVKERLCPECAGKLLMRKSKFGPFLGCSNYPKCRHIAKE